MARLNDTAAIVARGIRPPILESAMQLRFCFQCAEGAAIRGNVTSRLPRPQGPDEGMRGAKEELCKSC